MIGRRPRRPRNHRSISEFFISLFQMVQTGPTANSASYLSRPLLRGNNEDGREDYYSHIVPRLRMCGVLPPIGHTLSLRNA